MILDNAKNLSKYFDLSPNIKTAAKYLLETDLSAVTPGIHKIDGDEVYANVQIYETKPWDKGFFEAHKKYIDIQFVFSGSELITVAPESALEIDEDHFAEKDFSKYKDTVRGTDYVLNAGDFLILYPEDAHRPQILSEKSATVKKFVMKVKI